MLFLLFERCVGIIILFGSTPGFHYFFQHFVDIELAADFNVGDLVAFLYVESEPINYKQALDHVAVHTNFRVDFVELFQRFADYYRKHSQQRAQAYKLVPVEVLQEGPFVLAD